MHSQNIGHGQARKRATAPKNEKTGIYSNDGGKCSGVMSQLFPGWVFADSFALGGRIFVFIWPMSELLE